MVERAALVLGLAVALAVAVVLVRYMARRRAASLAGRPLPGALRSRFSGEGAGIVYFYGPRCGSCRQQAAILDQLCADDGVPVVWLDASREASLADALAVMTVPATIVVDGARTVRAVNLGLCTRETLLAQLHAAHPLG